MLSGGRRALADLEARYPGRLGYHGSPVPKHILEPRVSHWGDGQGNNYPDGPPAVCADTGYDIPTYMAMYKKLGGYRKDEAGNVEYVAVGGPEALRGKNLEGYVHVFDRGDLELQIPPAPEGWPMPVDRVPELRSDIAVRPFAIVKVTDDDFPHSIQDWSR
jgi:hypothetical protein